MSDIGKPIRRRDLVGTSMDAFERMSPAERAELLSSKFSPQADLQAERVRAYAASLAPREVGEGNDHDKKTRTPGAPIARAAESLRRALAWRLQARRAPFSGESIFPHFDLNAQHGPRRSAIPKINLEIPVPAETKNPKSREDVKIEKDRNGMKPFQHVTLEIARERARQLEAEGFTLEHDDAHRFGELAQAAAAYAANTDRAQVDVWAERPGGSRSQVGWLVPHLLLWPWSHRAWKPTTRRRDLIKAAALIVAEIERLDRLDGHR